MLSGLPLHDLQTIKKKCLATPMGTVTNGITFRALGGTMRKFRTFTPRALPFRFFLVVAGALLLMAAFAPRANASLIAYFNFEDAVNGAPPDFTSEADQGLGVATTITTNYTPADMETVANAVGTLNRVPTDVDTNAHSMGLHRTTNNNGAHFDIPLFTPQGFFQNMTVTFATNRNGNGFANVQLFFSTNGGGTFTAVGAPTVLPTSLILVTLPVPAGANNAPLLVLRLVFTNGGPGNDLQTVIDNIQVNGTIVPEPATVAGGLLGVLGLCWHQRRRLISSVRLRKA
jgi:hypothetical protein